MPSHLTKLIHVVLIRSCQLVGRSAQLHRKQKRNSRNWFGWPLTSNKRARHFSVLSRNPSTQVMVSCLPALLSPPH